MAQGTLTAFRKPRNMSPRIASGALPGLPRADVSQSAPLPRVHGLLSGMFRGGHKEQGPSPGVWGRAPPPRRGLAVASRLNSEPALFTCHSVIPQGK